MRLPRRARVRTIVRRFAWLAVIACGAPRAPEAPKPVPVSALDVARGEELRPEDTAGVYWVPYQTCPTCAQPAAIAAYVAADEPTARTIVAALRGKLALGLPYVVHGDELGVGPRAILVVVGSFGTRAAAEATATAAPAIGGHRAEAIAVDESQQRDAPESPRYVTVVDRGPPVPAYTKDDMAAARAAVDGGAFATIGDMHAAAVAAIRARPPLCSVRAGELFVVEHDDIQWYEFAPVRCGGTLAYIAWASSLLGHAVIVRDGAGHRLYQVIGAECDSPIIHDWSYDNAGRHDAPDPESGALVASRGC